MTNALGGDQVRVQEQEQEAEAAELRPLGTGAYPRVDSNPLPAEIPLSQPTSAPGELASNPYAALSSQSLHAHAAAPADARLSPAIGIEIGRPETVIGGGIHGGSPAPTLASNPYQSSQVLLAGNPYQDAENALLQTGSAEIISTPSLVASALASNPYVSVQPPLATPGIGSTPVIQANNPYQASAQAAPLEFPPLEAPLRVIHIGECMVRAGIEQWLRNLIRFVDQDRMRILRCIATSDTVDPSVAADMGVPVEMGQDKSIQRAALECDVLLVSGPGNVPQWLGPYHPKMCVFVAHGDSKWTQDILHSCAPIVDHVVAVSESANRLCDGFHSTIIHNGIDAAHVAQSQNREVVRRRLGFSDSDTVLGFVGRFSPEKRPEAVIEAVAGLPPEYKALLVGWGVMRDQLMEMANRLIPGRYAFAEAAGHLGDYYHAMDCLCFPSSSEGFGLVVLEAMYCGCPVIATPVGCVAEIMKDRVNGVVVPGDAESIRQAAALIRQHPTWARSIAAEAKQFADQYGHAFNMARNYERLLTGLWRRKHGVPTPNVAL